MKYPIPMALLLALSGCATNSVGPQDSATAAMPSDKVASEAALRYLDRPPKGRASNPGLYKMIRSGGIVDDPNTSTGKAVSKPVIERVKVTDRIPLIKGSQMYFQYRIWPVPDRPAYVDLRRVLKHPEMTLPDGSVSTGSDYMMKGKVSVNQVIGYTGYGLDEDYEMVEGDWTFQIWYQGKKMVEQTFTTYWPEKEEIADWKARLKPAGREMPSKQKAGKTP